jgi:hypothetical protein
MAESETTITGDIIKQHRENTKKILAQKGLSRADRVNFENQDLLLMFLEHDHKKIRRLDGLIQWMDWYKVNKRFVFSMLGFLFVAYHVVASAFYVSGWRKPILTFFGVPPEFIP